MTPSVPGEPIPGSCCCGAVRFELTQAPTTMGTCHCSRCRKVGASTIVFVKREHVRWIAGREVVRVYEPPPPFEYPRCFCGICGSSLGEILSEADTFPIAANAFDVPLDLANQFHEHTSEKPSWVHLPEPPPPA